MQCIIAEKVVFYRCLTSEGETSEKINYRIRY